MKQYRFSKCFDKQYAALPPKKQDAVEEALLLYLETPDTPRLRRHALRGNTRGRPRYLRAATCGPISLRRTT
jgi:hypothetical protein